MTDESAGPAGGTEPADRTAPSTAPDEPGPGDGRSFVDRAVRLRELLSVDLERPRTPEPESRRGARAAEPDVGAGPATAAPGGRSSTTHTGPRRARRWTSVSNLVLVALFAAGAGLIWAGTQVVRSSTQGEVVEPVRDPTAPGFEALLDPTPTMAVLHDLGGTVDAITVLTLPSPGDGGGGVVFVPTRVVVDIPLLDTVPLEAGYDLGSPSVQAEAVGDLLGAAIGEIAVVDADRWAGLVEPVAPLTVDNPDRIEVDGRVRFPVGEIELAPEDVGSYLQARVPGQSDPARLFRHESFWRAWLDAVTEAGTTEAVPGELSAGIGRFVRTLAQGPVLFESLPVHESASDEFGEEPVFTADVDGIEDLVERVIPFPRSPRPGVRPRVRVLNGTTDTDAASRVAPRLPPVGVEVAVVGNAASLDRTETTIAYVGPDHRDDAEAIREVLGVGAVIEDPRPSDVVDITVTLGADHD